MTNEQLLKKVVELKNKGEFCQRCAQNLSYLLMGVEPGNPLIKPCPPAKPKAKSTTGKAPGEETLAIRALNVGEEINIKLGDRALKSVRVRAYEIGRALGFKMSVQTSADGNLIVKRIE